MNVLSLFDGISCGRIALQRAGIKVDNYFSSEVDKYAMKVSQDNWDDITYIGDVTKVSYMDGVLTTENGNFAVKIDLIIGGSPCQGFSLAGKQLGFDDERSNLYFEYERLLKETGAKYFLLENVKMKSEHKQVITDRLGVQPLFINSECVAAQSRQRWYWTNIPNVTVPADKGPVLSDLIDGEFQVYRKKTALRPKPSALKAGCLTGGAHSGGNHSDMDVLVFDGAEIPVNSTGRINMFSTQLVRRYTPEECEMLQTVPVGYTASVSASQRYKALGNGWTVDVIAHIFQGLKT